MNASRVIRAHLGGNDPLPPRHVPAHARVTPFDLLSGQRSLAYGLGRALTDAKRLGLVPSETAPDLLILAALVYAADTRISRTRFSEDSWTREIELDLPVRDLALWTAQVPLLERMLRFLSGDIWTMGSAGAPRPFPC